MKTINLISLIFIVLTLQAQTNLQTEFIEEWESTYSNKLEFEGYKLYMPTNQACIAGDFFGDKVNDYAFFIIDTSNKVKLAFIDKGESEKIRILGLKDDPFDIDDYRWAEIFKKVEKGDVLWSNYTDDFRKLSEVPENEKVILNYDALYLHAAESCGGGFVFWKDGKFNWLQQE